LAVTAARAFRKFSGLTTSSIKFSYIAFCQRFREVPPWDRRRQARCGSPASARGALGVATAVVAPLDLRSLLGFPPVASLALSGSFRPSLHRHYPASSLLRRLLTSPPLSRRSSPQVRCRICPLGPSGSTGCVSDDVWALLFPASSPPAPGLTAGLYSYGREFATRFFRLRLAATSCVSLTVAVIGSGWLLSSNEFLPMLGHTGAAP
jgi:hypothetical protein